MPMYALKACVAHNTIPAGLLQSIMPTAPKVSDGQVKAVLSHYACPLPFHVVRARFFGAIISPSEASPLRALEDLWGGELPVMNSEQEINALLEVLVMGFWNQLSTHQDRCHPFRFVPLNAGYSRAEVLRFAQTRFEEIEGVMAGLYGREETISLPSDGSQAFDVLVEVGGMLHGAAVLLADEAAPASTPELKELMHNVQTMSRLAQKALADLAQACKAARVQRLETMGVDKPVLH